MTKSELLLRTILGPIRPDIRPLAFAMDIAGDLLFSQHFSMDDIHVTKNIYPDVARLIHRKPETASKRIERLSNRCWDALQEQGLVSTYLGRDVKQQPDPRSLIVHLAVYANLDIPLSTAIKQDPHFLFQSPDDVLPSRISDALLRDRPLRVSQVMTFLDIPGHPSFPVCPGCRITLEREYQGFCDRCGQRLDWTHFKNAQVIYPERLLSDS